MGLKGKSHGETKKIPHISVQHKSANQIPLFIYPGQNAMVNLCVYYKLFNPHLISLPTGLCHTHTSFLSLEPNQDLYLVLNSATRWSMKWKLSAETADC